MAAKDGQARLWGWVAAYAAARQLPISVSTTCLACVERIGVTGAAVMLFTNGDTDSAYVSDLVGRRLQDLELTLGEGPGTDAHHLGLPALAADLTQSRTVRRWPAFAPIAVESGADAVFAFPIRSGAIQIGALVLHRVMAGELGRSSLNEAAGFADLLLPLLLDEQMGPNGVVEAGMGNHYAEVHQATGMISVQLGATLEQAFVRLRARAFAEQRPLVDLAREVVARRLRFRPEPNPGPEPHRDAR